MNQNNNKYLSFDGECRKYLLMPLISMVVICLFPLLFTQFSIFDFSDTGQIGDTIGGIMSPFVAMIATLLTFLAFWVQYKANIQQRQDIARERFERHVFEMLNAQEQITSGLVLEKLNNKANTDNDCVKGNVLMKQRGRDTFQMIYEGDSKQGDSKQDKSEKPLKDLLREDKDFKKNLSEYKHLCFLDHYFRHLYRIYKFIDEYDEEVITAEMKKEYAEIVNSRLSSYELVILFYKFISETESKEIKEIVQKYKVLKHIRMELLATDEDRKLAEELNN